MQGWKRKKTEVERKGTELQSEYGAVAACVTFFFFRTFLKVFVTALATSPCPFPPHFLHPGRTQADINCHLLGLAGLVSVSPMSPGCCCAAEMSLRLMRELRGNCWGVWGLPGLSGTPRSSSGHASADAPQEICETARGALGPWSSGTAQARRIMSLTFPLLVWG